MFCGGGLPQQSTSIFDGLGINIVHDEWLDCHLEFNSEILPAHILQVQQNN